MSYLAQFLKITAVDLVFGLLYFPVWWYSSGLRLILGKCWRNVSAANTQLAWTLLGRYLFTPMYGDYTRSGRLISFFIRLIQYIVITTIMLVVALLNLGLALGWIVILPITVIFIIRNLMS